jgi:hypothetical protein
LAVSRRGQPAVTGPRERTFHFFFVVVFVDLVDLESLVDFAAEPAFLVVCVDFAIVLSGAGQKRNERFPDLTTNKMTADHYRIVILQVPRSET